MSSPNDAKHDVDVTQATGISFPVIMATADWTTNAVSSSATSGKQRRAIDKTNISCGYRRLPGGGFEGLDYIRGKTRSGRKHDRRKIGPLGRVEFANRPESYRLLPEPVNALCLSRSERMGSCLFLTDAACRERRHFFVQLGLPTFLFAVVVSVACAEQDFSNVGSTVEGTRKREHLCPGRRTEEFQLATRAF